MANTSPIPARPIPDIPLPGHYECITAQLNLTLQVRQGVAKWIVAMRDPSPGRQIELSRAGGVAPWNVLPEILTRAVDELLNGMTYLAALPEVTRGS